MLHHNVNQIPATGRDAIVQYITVIVAAGGSIHAWSDNDNPPVRDGSIPTAAQINNAGAWIEVVIPNHTATWVFQLGSNNTLWWVAESDGGLGTDGTSSTPDSAIHADLKDVCGTSASPGQLFEADGSYFASAIADDATSRTALLCWMVSDSRTVTEISTDPLTSLDPLDASTLYCRAYRSGDGNLVFSVAQHSMTCFGTWQGRTALGTGGSWKRVATVNWFVPGVGNAIPAGSDVSPFNSSKVAVRAFAYFTAYPITYKGVSALVAYQASPVANFELVDYGNSDEDFVALDGLLYPWPHGIPVSV